MRLTTSRLAFLHRMPVALRLTAGPFALLAVHGGPPRTEFRLEATSLPSAAASAREPGWNDLLWSNPAWTQGPQGAGYLYTDSQVVRFLEANACRMLVRGHRDEDVVRRLPGDLTLISVHSAKGPRTLDESRFGYSYVAWDPPAPPALVRVTCEPACPLPRPSRR